jgi:hypothetical protein
MSDIDWFNSGTGLLTSPDLGGSSSSSSLGSPLGLGALAIGGAGLGAILAEGESPLPSEFSTLTNTNVPWLESQANWNAGTGESLVGQGQSALAMAEAGQLTPEQQAQLSKYSNGLQNQGIQTFASMGRNYNEDTSAISAQANIDTQVNAMAQQQIQSTIALGLGEISSGNSFITAGSQDMSAANSALIAAGQAQVDLDKSYQSSLTNAFSSIAQMFSSIAGTAKAAAPAALALSDVRAKTDIRRIGTVSDGIRLYSFRYRGDWVPYVGVIAQEVREVRPDAVAADDVGLLLVDYTKINAPFMTYVDWRSQFTGNC